MIPESGYRESFGLYWVTLGTLGCIGMVYSGLHWVTLGWVAGYRSPFGFDEELRW